MGTKFVGMGGGGEIGHSFWFFRAYGELLACWGR